MTESRQNFLDKSKSWDKSLEPRILEFWNKQRLFDFNSNSGKAPFVIDTPPPYPSGRPWHIGAAAQYSEIDMIARSARMTGKEVLFPIGIDRNGLPVELYTEKKYNVNIRNTPREKFLELCSMALDDLEAEMIGIMKRMGLSGDFENKYRTDSRDYRILTQSTFIEQWRSGRIYTGNRPTNYCVDDGTTIADAEIEYAELPTKLVYFKFKIEESGNQSITVASTRPELLCSCQAIIVNPEDERYKPMVGKKANLPFYNRSVPVVAHPSAKPDFGSGAVMVCSYGDYSDVLLFRELSLPETIAINLEGKMTTVAGEKLEGLKIKAARKEMISMLERENFLIKVEEIYHRTPLCERSKTPIEIIPLEEYYLKVVDFKDRLRTETGNIRFHPPAHRQILLNWIDAALDWPISRRRFYGTEVPVWYCKGCGTPYVPEPGKYYQPWKDSPPGNPHCSKCQKSDFKGDERTFDTWMDSSVSPLYITNYQNDKRFFEKTYPAGIRPQGKDIIRTWLHYSLLRCLQITGKTPWRDVWITGMGLDERGERMSKSRGNVIDPIPVLDQFGADCFRLWAASEVSLGSDFNISVAKISGMGKFLTKLWNIARFVSPLPRQADQSFSFSDYEYTDRWMLSELSKLTKNCLEGYYDYNFFIPANRIRDFTWNTFAAHYIELAKGRAYGQGFSEKEKISAQLTLREGLRTILLLLAPICPFICDEIWIQLFSNYSIHIESFPRPEKWNQDYLKYGKELMEFDSLVWNEKKRKGLSLKDPIEIKVPESLRPFSKDLSIMHNLRTSL
jgi:valyl-tRNA synthetase